MSRSSKITRILLMAAFAAGLSACSAENGAPAPASPSGSEITPTPTPSASASAKPSSSAVPTDPPVAAEPTADTRGDGAGDNGPAVYLLGPLSANPAQPGWITVQTGGGDTQPVMLGPDTVVLDAKGTICTTGPVPHRCTAAQLEKALNARKPLNAKVVLQGGVAVRIEATSGK